MLKDYIENYLTNQGWEKKIENGRQIFCKNNNLEHQKNTKKSKCVYLQQIIDNIKNYFQIKNYHDIHFDSVINPYRDTDYIIAALQTINKIKYNDIGYDKLSWYSFQPCIRPIPNGKKISDGFIPSFVNVGTISIGQNKDDYCNMIEDWISILSKCSIYISRIKLITKEKTKAYNGMGLSIYVDDFEIGQANYYKTKDVFDLDDDTFVLDFGFGLERIAWASNWFDDFNHIYQSTEDYFLHNDILSALINKQVLLIMSNVQPNSSKFGLKLRTDFQKIFSICKRMDVNESIKFAYNYWKQFISTEKTLEDVYTIWSNEINYLINTQLSNCLNIKPNIKRLKQNSCDFCTEIFREGVRRK